MELSDEEILAQLNALSELIKSRKRKPRKPQQTTEEIVEPQEVPQLIKQEEPTEPKKRGRPKIVKETPTEPDEIKKRGRPMTPWRHGENGKYNRKCLDQKYYIKYWHEHYKKEYTCEICGKCLTCIGGALHAHRRTMHCQLAKLKKEKEQEQSN